MKKGTEKAKYDEQTIKHEFEEAYKQAWAHWGPFLREARKDHRVVMGDQWSASDKRALKLQARNPLVFNKAKRVIRLVEGYQRKHRLALKVDPVEGSDDKTAEQLTGCLMWVLQYSNAYNIFSDAFSGGSLKTGLNLVNIYMDYTEDPVNGDIRFKRIPYNKILLDPNFTERDLSDCTYLLRREYFARETCMGLLPGREPDIKALKSKGRDNKFAYFSPPTDLRGDAYLRYDEFWVQRYKPINTIIDKQTGAWYQTKKRLTNERIAKLTKLAPQLVFTKGYKPTGIYERVQTSS